MSSKIVRRLLQNTSDLGRGKSETKRLSVSQKRKLRKRQALAAQPPVEEQQVVDQQVQNLLYLDGAMTSLNNKQKLAAQRVKKEHSQQRTAIKKSLQQVFGNSRSSASGMKAKRVATTDKKTYRKQQEQKRLAHIAKLLKKNSKKSKSKH